MDGAMFRIGGFFRKHISDFESFLKEKLNLEESEWLKNFRQDCRIDAVQFAEIWNNFDRDGNGYIDGYEIDEFFNALLAEGMKHKSLSDADKERIKQEFMHEFDENRDGKIEMRELAKILPPEDNFLILFRNENHITIREFMNVWRKFAGKKKAYIEAHEVKFFLAELLNIEDSGKLEHYTKSVIKIYDSNNDGKLSFSEMSRLLPPDENVLLKFRNQLKLSPENFEELFNSYDLNDFASSPDELARIKQMLLVSCDESGDGDLQKEEIALWLGITAPQQH